MTMKKFYAVLVFTFAAAFLNMTVSAGTHFDGYIVKLSEAPAMLFSTSNEADALQKLGYIKADTESEARQLVDFGIGVSFEPDYISELYDESFEPVDDKYSSQYAPAQIKADKVWKMGYYGDGVKVVVIDSGYTAHPDLDGRVKQVFNAMTASFPELFPDDTDVTDDVGHGNHVAGIVAASLDGSGVVGVAPKCDLGIIKAFCNDDSAVTTLSLLSRAIIYAVDEMDADIINMSLGCPSTNAAFTDAVSYALERGVILCAAVGNAGLAQNTVSYPAAFDGVIGVCSVDKTMKKAANSSANSTAFISAGGVSVMSCGYKTNELYRYNSGTSMACPAVSGAVALLLSASSGLSADEIRGIISRTALDLGEPGYDTGYGYGLLDAYALIYETLGDGLTLSPETELTVNGVTKKYFSASYKGSKGAVAVSAEYDETGNKLSGISLDELFDGASAKFSYLSGEKYPPRRIFFFESLENLKPLRERIEY